MQPPVRNNPTRSDDTDSPRVATVTAMRTLARWMTVLALGMARAVYAASRVVVTRDQTRAVRPTTGGAARVVEAKGAGAPEAAAAALAATRYDAARA